MTAGTWAPARKFDLYGDLAGTGNCSCGAKADDLHRIWRQCPDRVNRPAFTKSEHLVPMAVAGVAHAPCFWLRGLPPTSWTTPPPCETPRAEE
eukprot:7093675-Pyramimonas_sp.AAC.1